MTKANRQKRVDGKTESFLRRRLKIAKQNRDGAERAQEKARKKRSYWAGIVYALESRLGLVEQGQTEFELNECDRPSDLSV